MFSVGFTLLEMASSELRASLFHQHYLTAPITHLALPHAHGTALHTKVTMRNSGHSIGTLLISIITNHKPFMFLGVT